MLLYLLLFFHSGERGRKGREPRIAGYGLPFLQSLFPKERKRKKRD
jgi:hypothetical protein